MASPFEPCFKCKSEYLIDCKCPSGLLEVARALVKSYIDNFGVITPKEINDLHNAILMEEK